MDSKLSWTKFAKGAFCCPGDAAAAAAPASWDTQLLEHFESVKSATDNFDDGVNVISAANNLSGTIAGKFGNCCDGSTGSTVNYIMNAAQSNFGAEVFNNDFVLDFWVIEPTVSLGNVVIQINGQGATYTRIFIQFVAGKLRFACNWQGNFASSVDGDALPDTSWHYVRICHDSTNHKVYIYQDDTLTATYSDWNCTSDPFLAFQSLTMYITAATNHNIDELRIRNNCVGVQGLDGAATITDVPTAAQT